MTPNLVAFLAMIARCEVGTTAAIGYRTLYGGGTFDSFADHPRKPITAGRYTSTAAGRYQALAGTWDDFCRAKGSHDFSPASQDEFCVWCITRRGALADVEAGRIPEAIARCGKEWASLPGSPYGQPVRTLAECLRYYTEAGGTLAQTIGKSPQVPKQRNAPVDPLTATLFSTIVQSLPDIFKAFGKADSPKAAIVQRVAEVATSALGVGGPGAALDALQGPEAAANVAKVAEAVKADPQLSLVLAEVGGGIVGAQAEYAAINRDYDDDPPWRIAMKFLFNPVHWVTGVFLFYVQQFIPALASKVEELDGAAAMGLIVIVFGVIALVGSRWLGVFTKQEKGSA